MARNFYETLGLSMSAAENDISASLDREIGLATSLQRIPSRYAEAEARHQALQQIRQTLLNPTTRSKYDAYLSAVAGNDRPPIGFAAVKASCNVLPASENAVTVFCSSCGRPSRNQAKFCAGCGNAIEPASSLARATTSHQSDAIIVPLMPATVSCVNCGGEAVPGQNYCNRCQGFTVPSQLVAKVSTVPATPLKFLPSQPYQSPVASTWPDLSPYYQNEFRLIQESGESYKGRWNWASFCFGGLWALSKGLWLPFILAGVVSLLTLPLAGIGAIVYWVIFGARGNYMYYCARAKHQQRPF